jgi:2,4-dienoyl-CoA reductase-like NADH-dependent reductase (Old Yellow Enzyme family)/NADPH-dependent 2,4-dienoyl-CoA reductase/sulfur reductase-like enzyme
MSHRHTHLLSPGRIGGMALRNRIALAAMGTNFAAPDGHCTERLIAYYEARAKGGAGLLVLETSAALWPHGSGMPNTIGFSDDSFLPGLRELTGRIHHHGAKVVAQLNHSGKMAQEDAAAGRPIPVPSRIKPSRSEMMNVLTREEASTFIKSAGPDGKGPTFYEMTPAQIAETAQGFAAAAARARRAGFDGVELHAGHGYLLASFLSPYTNRRTDDYGGTALNRARFLLETIAAVRAATAPDFPILVRLDAHEYRIEGGIRLADCVETARLCERAGADAIDVSAYGNVAHAIAFTEAPLVHEPGGFIEFAKAVKRAVSIPVIAVGRIEPAVADRGIAAGHFDYVAMGRILLADPDLPNKLSSGREKSVTPCIYCYTCVSQIFINKPVRCAVNHSTGREYEGDILARTGAPKTILVIGGGPGGMEAARLLAEKGHRVSLWEKDADLGGTARIAGLAYEPNEQLVHYLAAAVRALPIALQLGTTATPENIAALNPDHVILATGAKRTAPDIPGKLQRHVFDGDLLRGLLFGSNPAALAKLSMMQRLVLNAGRLSQVLRHIGLLRLLSKLWMPIAREVVIIGGGLVGLELAEYLVERRRNVTVLEPGPTFGPELAIVRRARVLHQLQAHGAALHKSVAGIAIGERTVRFSVNEQTQEKACEQVIIAMGAQPDDSLFRQLSGSGARVHQIGDCRNIGYIEGAMLDARELVQRLDAEV